MQSNNRASQSIFMLCMMLTSTAVIAQQFPTEAEINTLLRGCGAGSSNEIASTFNESVEIWKAEVRSAGRAEARSIVSILESLENDRTKLEAYTIYVDCFQTSLERFVSSSFVPSRLSAEETKRFEDQLLEEIAVNLSILDSKLWLMEPLGTYDGYIHTKPGEVNLFNSAVEIPFSTDRYELLEKHLDQLSIGYEIKRFYRWLSDTKLMHQTIAKRFAPAEFDAYNDPERAFLQLIRMAQRQGIHLYVYGCKQLPDRVDCKARLEKVQSEFKLLKNYDKPIMDVELDRLESLLEEASGVIASTSRKLAE